MNTDVRLSLRSVQVLKDKNGADRFAVIPMDEFHRLVEFVDEAAGVLDYDRTSNVVATGADERVPETVADRLMSGENPIRVWREHRGLTAFALAAQAGITQVYLSQIETGKREGEASVIRALAKALSVSMEDLVAD